MIKKIKMYLLNFIIAGLFKGVTLENVIEFDNKKGVLINKETLTERQKKTLVEEAKYIEKTELWKILTSTLRHNAHQTMFEKSTVLDDLFFAKAMLYNIDVQEKIVTIVKKLH
jgi:hypothetical protein